jgi:hypothetical protein
MACVIVLGCYRSGTSAVAGVLQKLGVNMGFMFDSPTSNNIHGYYEDIEFKNFHTKFDAGDLDVNPQLLDNYASLIKRREQESDLWGIKDPLLCTNLSRFVYNLQTNHKLIVCHRPINEIGKSMAIALKESDLKRYMPLANFYVGKMHEQIKNYKGDILQMHHHDMLSNPVFQVQRIANFTGLQVTQEAISHIEAK